MMSIGTGKMIVEFFSADIVFSVCRYRSCKEKRVSCNSGKFSRRLGKGGRALSPLSPSQVIRTHDSCRFRKCMNIREPICTPLKGKTYPEFKAAVTGDGPLTCRADGLSEMTSDASLSARDAFCSPSAAITCEEKGDVVQCVSLT